MLKTTIMEGTNIVAVTVAGSVSAEEDVAAQETFADAASQQGSASMLLDYDGIDVGRVEPKAVWEDLKGIRLLDHIDRVAVVADSELLDGFIKAIGAIARLEVRTFASGKRDAAVAWLST